MDLTLGVLTLGAAQWVVGALSVLFLLTSVVLILTVLIQRPQGGGLSGAFGGGGGGGSGETAFGARTGDALTIATIAFFVIWLVVAVGLVWVMQPAEVGGGPAAVSTDPGDVGTTGDGTTAPTDDAESGADAPTGDTESGEGDDAPIDDGAGSDDAPGDDEAGGEASEDGTSDDGTSGGDDGTDGSGGG